MKSRDVVLLLGIAWLCIGIAAIGTGIFGFLQDLISPFPNEEVTFPIAFLDVFTRYRTELTIGQVLIGSVIVLCAIAFLKRYKWSRYIFQIFALINIIWSVVFITSWIQGVRMITTSATDFPGFEYFGIGMIFFGIGAVIFTCGLWGFCIWLVNRPRIRAEFTK
jgi:hypothetical protein